MKNLDLFASEMQRHTIPIGLVGKTGLMLFGRGILQQLEEIVPVVLMPNIEHVLIDGIAPGEATMES